MAWELARVLVRRRSNRPDHTGGGLHDSYGRASEECPPRTDASPPEWGHRHLCRTTVCERSWRTCGRHSVATFDLGLGAKESACKHRLGYARLRERCVSVWWSRSQHRGTTESFRHVVDDARTESCDPRRNLSFCADVAIRCQLTKWIDQSLTLPKQRDFENAQLVKGAFDSWVTTKCPTTGVEVTISPGPTSADFERGEWTWNCDQCSSSHTGSFKRQRE